MKHLIYLSSILIVLAGCKSSSVKTQSRTAVPGGSSVNRSSDAFLFSVRSRFLDNGSQIRTYVHIQPDRELSAAEFAQEFRVRFKVLPDYNSRQELQSNKQLTLAEGQNFTRKKNAEGSYFTVWFDVPKPEGQVYTGVVMTEITDAKGGMSTHDTFVRFRSGKVGDYYALFDAQGKTPLLENFVRQGDTVQLASLNKIDTSFYIFHYNFDFDVALPPMATLRPQPKRLFVDSSARIATNKTFRINQEGLHYIVRDTTDTYGIGIIGVADRYPRYTYPQQLARPLVYMSTNQEINDLRNGPEAKRSLDRYWLAVSNGNQQTAKRTIASFYRRVERANALFTSYKEGWKTDRGMVYIIMGTPNRVNRSKDREVWVYTKRNSQFSEINFTFNKRNNQFVEDHYELSRFVEFQPIWYPAVEAWRNGEIE
ncbi:MULTISPECIES: GWxTD domain-containing protein [unclassified Siphonobacter]|uniref:GWxTD domain-containing protein n=1 Tax=unclassified Siphonobacter TaxID=2635712 RepID=UPI000CAAE730|nr:MULTISPECIES: GWxTD domain-containing protein [unclassified Siphonobacter]MDQ1086273.1 GWxTD domain-containing protein [Siphonobacter sp. SORGH_AS_1065]PKK35821.1 hypothetical protein BWI96_14915 [Siphonobacter sp. SORGH_AS_0500]